MIGLDAEAQTRIADAERKLQEARDAQRDPNEGIPVVRAERLGPQKVRLYAKGYDGHEHVDELSIGSATAREKYARRTALVFECEQADVLKAVDRVCLDVLGSDDAERMPVAHYVDDEFNVELAWNRDDNTIDFIVFDIKNEDVSRETSLKTSSGIITIPSICQGICTPGGRVRGAIYLPDTWDPSGRDEDALRADVRAFIDRYVELPGDAALLVVEFVLLSWVFDRFDEVPYLAFRTADAGRGKSRAIETVGALCRRAMFVGGGSSAAATLRLLDMFGGTLIADEFDFKRESELAATVAQILNQGFQANRPLIKCDGEDNTPRAFQCFGPKLFALRGQFSDDATESRTISIQMLQRTRPEIPISLPRVRFDAEALALRNRLLAWRFENHHRIQIDPTLAAADLEDRLNQIGLPLLAVARSDDARARIINALREQQGAVAAERSETLAGEVLAVVLAVAASGDDIRPRHVAQTLNKNRADADGVEVDKLGKRRLTAELVGRVFRRDLELRRLSRDSIGVRYTLDAVRADELRKRFGVPSNGQPTQLTLPTPTPEPTPEKPSLWPENGENVGCVGSVGSEGVDGETYIDDTTYTDPDELFDTGEHDRMDAFRQ